MSFLVKLKSWLGLRDGIGTGYEDLDSWFSVRELVDAEPVVGALFRRRFHKAWQVLRRAGGIAEQLMRRSLAALPAATRAVWARIGHPKSEIVCRKVGFEKVDAEYIFVVWRDPDLSEADKQDLIRQVEALGSF